VRAALDVHRLGRPGDGTGPDGRARIVRFEPFCMAHSLVVAGEALMRPMEDDKPQTLTHPRTTDCSCLPCVDQSQRQGIAVPKKNETQFSEVECFSKVLVQFALRVAADYWVI
jgi:hypothetical protein